MKIGFFIARIAATVAVLASVYDKTLSHEVLLFVVALCIYGAYMAFIQKLHGWVPVFSAIVILGNPAVLLPLEEFGHIAIAVVLVVSLIKIPWPGKTTTP